MIYPSVLNLVQRFDQQRRGFLQAPSYISIYLIIYLYIGVFIYPCVFFPAVLFDFLLLGLLKTLFLTDSWTISHRIQQPRGLKLVRDLTHSVIMSDTIHFLHFKRT